MTQSAWGDERTRFFFELTPDRVLEAVEESGFRCTGLCIGLNSFENRVYEVELETDGAPPSKASERLANRRIVKFYRPGRWTREQILEEHLFIQDLNEAEIPAVAPLRFPDGATLRQTPGSGIWYTLFPKIGGRAPDELDADQLVRIGRLLGRMHGVGAARAAVHRVEIGPETYGRANLKFLSDGDWVPAELRTRFADVVSAICEAAAGLFAGVAMHRIHGDCHLGNLLWSERGPFFVDFDDMLRGPAVQDLWLLIPGRDEGAREKLELMLSGYEEMRGFDRRTLRLVEPLRALRFVHFCAWIARRWEDPAFPLAFPQFGTPRYWNELTLDLEEQLRLIRPEGAGLA